jgi:hypothetical protein
VQPDCATYNPGNFGAETYVPVSVTTCRALPCDPAIQGTGFDCDQQSFLMWWMQNMPGLNNTALDCGGNPMPNWWQYIVALDTVTGSTTNDCAHSGRMSLSPTGGPGQTNVTVSGSNFAQDEPVQVYWNSTTAPAIATTTASTTGTFSVTFRVPQQPSGSYSVIAVGQASGQSATAVFSLTPSQLGQYLPSGAFMLGDRTAASARGTSTTVTWWGANWSSLNTLSGGAAPSSFKGFAESTATPPVCGGTWTARPGNSSGPPSSVPTYMFVIVSSKTTQSGSTISGDVAHIDVVQTNAGYAPSPDHPGTGTVVAHLC